MKIAIHKQNSGFCDRWIKYCNNNNVNYKLVNAYDSDIVMQLDDCDTFMWHHDHADYRDVLFGKQLLYSIQTTGKKVFPDFNTGWHFDDKVAQKYLLEAIGAPLVPSFVFYDRKEALNWAASQNIKLVAEQIPIANIIDLETNLVEYRKMLYRNSRDNNRVKIVLN